MNPDELTTGERFWLWRRRANINRAQAAAQYGVGVKQITDWEHDRREDTPEVPLKASLSDGEHATIQRRRSDLTIREAARMMGISHVTLINKEYDRTTADDVVRFWDEFTKEQE